MKRLSFVLVASALLIALIAAIIYLLQPSAPKAPVSLTQIPTATKPGNPEPERLSTVRTWPVAATSQAKAKTPAGPAPIQAGTKPAWLKDTDMDLAKYSSNPPQEPWEKEIIGLVNTLGIPDVAKAERLISRIPSLPPDGKVLALEHAMQLLPDPDYLRLRPSIFQLSNNSEEMRESLLVDVLSRTDEVRMPTLVEMLRQPPNPAQEEIREILIAYIDHDYGNDAAMWDVAVKKWLVENPE